MTPWSVDVQVPVNGHVRKAVVELRHNGDLVHEDKRDLEIARDRRDLVQFHAAFCAIGS